MALVDQAAMLAPGGRVRLVEVDASEFSGGIHRFHYAPFPHTPEEIDVANGDEQKLGPKPIVFGGNTYDFWPFQVSGLSYQQTRRRSPPSVSQTLTAISLRCACNLRTWLTPK